MSDNEQSASNGESAESTESTEGAGGAGGTDVEIYAVGTNMPDRTYLRRTAAGIILRRNVAVPKQRSHEPDQAYRLRVDRHLREGYDHLWQSIRAQVDVAGRDKSLYLRVMSPIAADDVVGFDDWRLQAMVAPLQLIDDTVLAPGGRNGR